MGNNAEVIDNGVKNFADWIHKEETAIGNPS